MRLSGSIVSRWMHCLWLTKRNVAKLKACVFLWRLQKGWFLSPAWARRTGSTGPTSALPPAALCCNTVCFCWRFGPISFHCILQSESNQWTKACINCCHLSHKSGAINQTALQRMAAWGESGCRDYCCEFVRSSLGYVSGFALRSACQDLLQVEVEGAQTHFKIKDPVFGGTLSCLVVFDFRCRHRGGRRFFFFFFYFCSAKKKETGFVSSHWSYAPNNANRPE